jgi:Tol biopolymer transport system component
MRLTPGTRLGPYEVVGPVGAGGMGEVYRAHDSRLGRSVAVKVLPAELASDAHRRRRFEREARAVAALSHPNVCAVFDVGREETGEGPVDYLVMELLEGESLAQRLRRGPLPTADLLEITAEVASALDAAHRAGVVHRDVKPGNILLTRSAAKLLDFGLASLHPPALPAGGASAAATEEATHGDSLTDAGRAVGTYPYMAPEQLEGKTVDGRADLFALGAVVYEMATGQRAFSGPSQATVAAAILTSDPPPLTTLRPAMPQSLERLVRMLLAKDPDERVQAAHDVVLRLREIAEEGGGARAAVALRTRRRRKAVAGTLSVVTLVLAAAALWRWTHPSAPLPAPTVVPLTTLTGVEVFPAFSPDGEQVAFMWGGEESDNGDIYLTMVGSAEVRRLTTDPAPEIAPSWSPDGRQIAFTCGRPGSTGIELGPMTICLVSPLGGSVRRLSDFPVPPFPAPSWSPDGRWLAVARAPSPAEPGLEGLYLVPVQGGEPRRLVLPEGARRSHAPSFAPDGRHLAYLSYAPGASSLEVVELSADYEPMGSPRRLTPPPTFVNSAPAWTRDGGSVVYVAVARGARELWRVGIAGDRPPERIEIAGHEVWQPAAAASRDRLVFVRTLHNAAIYRFGMGRPSEPILQSSFGFDFHPDLSPDGRRMAFESGRSGQGNAIWLAEADGSHPSRLTRGPGLHQGSPCWSPDGGRIAFDSRGADGHLDIWTIGADGSSLRQLTRDPGEEAVASWSRDGRLVYFTAVRTASGESGPEVWRVPAGGGPEERVTDHGGWRVQESLDGQTLFYKRSLQGSSPLLALPLAGGQERPILDCVSDFTVGPAGLYYTSCSRMPPFVGPAAPGRPPWGTLFLMDLATGESRPLGSLEWAGHWSWPTVSPDGRTILLEKWEDLGSDLMLIENFR